MHGEYKVVIEAWPFSSGNGSAIDNAGVAPAKREFVVEADSFDQAYQSAKLIQQGIISHDKVWMAPIVSVVCKGE